MQTNGNFSDMYKKLLIFPTVQVCKAKVIMANGK